MGNRMTKWKENPTYLGDVVYAYFDGFGIELRFNQHDAPCSVYLEPSVIQALNEFVRNLAVVEGLGRPGLP